MFAPEFPRCVLDFSKQRAHQVCKCKLILFNLFRRSIQVLFSTKLRKNIRKDNDIDINPSIDRALIRILRVIQVMRRQRRRGDQSGRERTRGGLNSESPGAEIDRRRTASEREREKERSVRGYLRRPAAEEARSATGRRRDCSRRAVACFSAFLRHTVARAL